MTDSTGRNPEASINLPLGAILAPSLIGERFDDAWLARVVECPLVAIAMEPSR